ncbi:MAG TPA: PqqD family protein [Caulobacteraceae bacterium]
MDKSYRVCAPAVVSEVIDGEAIIMDLRSGHYFSADGSGALVWQAVADGCGRAAILAWATEAFDAEPERVSADIDAFLAQLTEHGLVEAKDADAGTPAPAPVARGAYRTPTLAVYTDMQDLLLLDPIHDVDEAGWPTRKVDESQG